MWRATNNTEWHTVLTEISIHALRVEGDPEICPKGYGAYNFYPRPPCGGRQYPENNYKLIPKISIHALRVEGDTLSMFAFVARLLFLSTPSVWRATVPLPRRGVLATYFYPRPPCGGRRAESASYQ